MSVLSPCAVALQLLVCFICAQLVVSFLDKPWVSDFHPKSTLTKYSYFPESDRLKMIEETKKMFYFGYDSYMNHAFPMDELNPILCTGRGPDYDNP